MNEATGKDPLCPQTVSLVALGSVLGGVCTPSASHASESKNDSEGCPRIVRTGAPARLQALATKSSRSCYLLTFPINVEYSVLSCSSSMARLTRCAYAHNLSHFFSLTSACIGDFVCRVAGVFLQGRSSRQGVQVVRGTVRPLCHLGNIRISRLCRTDIMSSYTSRVE